MPAGRPRKPTAIKEADGNPGKRKLNKSEPKPQTMLDIEPPKFLSKAAKPVWKFYAGKMTFGVLTAVDTGVFAAWCEAEAIRQALQNALDGQPLMATGSTGQMIVNPLVRQIADQSRLLVTLASKLGFDPISRQAMHVQPDSGALPSDVDDFGIEHVRH